MMILLVHLGASMLLGAVLLECTNEDFFMAFKSLLGAIMYDNVIKEMYDRILLIWALSNRTPYNSIHSYWSLACKIISYPIFGDLNIEVIYVLCQKPLAGADAN